MGIETPEFSPDEHFETNEHSSKEYGDAIRVLRDFLAIDSNAEIDPQFSETIIHDVAQQLKVIAFTQGKNEPIQVKNDRSDGVNEVFGKQYMMAFVLNDAYLELAADLEMVDITEYDQDDQPVFDIGIPLIQEEGEHLKALDSSYDSKDVIQYPEDSARIIVLMQRFIQSIIDLLPPPTSDEPPKIDLPDHLNLNENQS